MFNAAMMLISGASDVSTTWDPLNKGASITLSGGNLVATTSSASVQVVKATISQSTGNYIFSVTIGTGYFAGNVRVGLAKAAASLTASLGPDTNSIGYQSTAITYNGSNQTALASYTTGDIIKVHFDGTFARFFKNDVVQGTATSIGSGPWFPAVSMIGAGNFETANFNPTVPGGYTANAWG